MGFALYCSERVVKVPTYIEMFIFIRRFFKIIIKNRVDFWLSPRQGTLSR